MYKNKIIKLQGNTQIPTTLKNNLPHLVHSHVPKNGPLLCVPVAQLLVLANLDSNEKLPRKGKPFF